MLGSSEFSLRNEVVASANFHYTLIPHATDIPSMLKPELQTIVDHLCADGCKAVNQYISAMQAGDFPATMRALNHQERDLVLAELKSIMAVYDRCG